MVHVLYNKTSIKIVPNYVILLQKKRRKNSVKHDFGEKEKKNTRSNVFAHFTVEPDYTLRAKRRFACFSFAVRSKCTKFKNLQSKISLGERIFTHRPIKFPRRFKNDSREYRGTNRVLRCRQIYGIDRVRKNFNVIYG